MFRGDFIHSPEAWEEAISHLITSISSTLYIFIPFIPFLFILWRLPYIRHGIPFIVHSIIHVDTGIHWWLPDEDDWHYSWWFIQEYCVYYNCDCYSTPRTWPTLSVTIRDRWPMIHFLKVTWSIWLIHPLSKPVLAVMTFSLPMTLDLVVVMMTILLFLGMSSCGDTTDDVFGYSFQYILTDDWYSWPMIQMTCIRYISVAIQYSAIEGYWWLSDVYWRLHWWPPPTWHSGDAILHCSLRPFWPDWPSLTSACSWLKWYDYLLFILLTYLKFYRILTVCVHWA